MESPDTILDCGIITDTGKSKDTSPFDRIDRITDELIVVVKEWKLKGVDAAVLEITSGHQAGRMRGRMAGLATLGGAIASVRSALKALPITVHEVKENVWTRRRPKARRAQEIQLHYPKVDWSKDTGMDMADAVGLGKYWLTVLELKGAA